MNTFSPVEGSRLKQTPVPEVSPLLPNTIAITETAVPFKEPSLMLFNLRYLIARGFIQEPNTAPIAPHICFLASCGNSSPLTSLYISLYFATTSFKFSTESSWSDFAPAFSFTSSRIASNLSWSTPIATSPYI